MAYSVNETARLTKRVILSNLMSKRGEMITPLISGQHGIGKSQVVKEIAKALGGHAVVLEASMLSEGEITGLPVVGKTADGGTEVKFVPHYTVSAVMRAQREYFEKARKEGFLGGSVGIDAQGNTFVKFIDEGKEAVKIVSKFNVMDNIIRGDSNNFSFGEELDFEVKLRLIESGEITPVVLFIDELNRTDNQTMRELMNVCLNKVVNGYELPWWCFVVGAINPADQDSQYATNEMDPAQLDRFIKFKTTAKLDDWVDFCLEAGLNSELIQAVAMDSNMLMGKANSALQDKTEADPSPRSWSMIANFMNSMEVINNTRFFTNDERKLLKEDFREIMYSKVGATAGRTVMSALENKERMVKASEIINGDAPEIDPKVLKKMDSQKAIERKITADNVLRLLCEDYKKFEKYSEDKDMKVRNKFVNFQKQLNQYIKAVDNSTMILFLKKVMVAQTKEGKKLFFLISKFFSKEAIEIITKFRNDEKEINREEN